MLNIDDVILIIKHFVTISQCITKNKLLILQKNIMKKVFFSAVALVAFSFAGMANEIEEKKVEVKKVEVETLKGDNCSTIRTLAYNLWISEGYSTQYAVIASNIAYNNCKAMLEDCVD